MNLECLRCQHKVKINKGSMFTSAVCDLLLCGHVLESSPLLFCLGESLTGCWAEPQSRLELR